MNTYEYGQIHKKLKAFEGSIRTEFWSLRKRKTVQRGKQEISNIGDNFMLAE